MAKPKSILVPASQNESIRIRKIDNGYIVSRDGMDKKGNYKQSEVFSPTKPDVIIGTEPKLRRAPSPPNALMAAAAHAKGKN